VPCDLRPCELNDSNLFAQIAGEKALGDHRVNAAHNVDDLSYAKADRDAAEGVGVELGEAGARGEEVNGIACGETHGDVQVFVQSEDDPVRGSFGDGPGEIFLFVKNYLDTQFLHARF